VLRKIEEIQNIGLKISMIAPSHGVIWRKDPMKIVEKYVSWARGDAEKKALVVYDTMWGSTEKMAMAIIEGLRSEGIETMVFRLPYSDRGDIIKELLGAKGIIVGSSTINNSILPTMAPFLEEMVGLKPRKKVTAIFGSYGWGGGAAKTIEERLKAAGMDIVAPSLTVKWAPSKDELQKCIEFGKKFAETLKLNGIEK
jgi:flavodoxin short chain